MVSIRYCIIIVFIILLLLQKLARTIYESNMPSFFTGLFEPVIRLVLTRVPFDRQLQKVVNDRHTYTLSDSLLTEHLRDDEDHERTNDAASR